jgi:putative ABC transport system permease protein
VLRVTLRSLWDHKRRLASTVVAIVLGVAFLSGTFVFADTIDRVFDDLFADVNRSIDVRVQGVTSIEGGFGPRVTELLDESVVGAIRDIDGVAEAEPFVQALGFGSQNRVLGSDGRPLGAAVGPPTLVQSWVPGSMNPYRVAAGRAPDADDEVALNVAAAEDGGFALGDPVRLVTQEGERTYELVGTLTFGDAKSAGGSVAANVTFREAQRIAGVEGRTQEVVVAAADGVDPSTLARRVQRVLPPTAEALTGEEAAARDSSRAQEGFSFFRQMLAVFGAIALLVGTFIIANTFSILVAQRTRELALLRAVGASRRQVLTSVLLEAVVIGTVAAVLGLGAGIALAVGVTAALSAAGADLPSAGLVIRSPTALLALGVGLGITLVAAVTPAIHATRVPPLAALRDVAVDRAGTSWARRITGAALLGYGAWQLSGAWRSDDPALAPVGLGAAALLIGAIVIGPVLVEPTVRALGAGLPRLRGITGALATENAARNPRRTSATASALLIGVALIGFVTIFGASARESIVAEVERGFAGDLVIQSEGGSFGPPRGFPATVADAAEAIPGVEAVSRIGLVRVEVALPDGSRLTQFTSAIDPTTIDRAFTGRMAVGTVTDLRPGGVIVDAGVADDEGLGLGDVVRVLGPSGDRLDLEVVALSDDRTLFGSWTVHAADGDRLVLERSLIQAVVSLGPGADLEVVRGEIEAAVEGVPAIAVLDRDGFVGTLTDQITSFLTLVNALLALSVVIAVIGIGNTLSLSIHERTRELGLLRAVGMTRAQVRAAVRWEAVLIAVIGTLVGLALALTVAWALVTALGSSGLSRFSVPTGQLAIVVGVGAALGVLASIRPARRAARLDVLDAIAVE